MKFSLVVLAVSGLVRVAVAGPSSSEVLEEMNFARTSPKAYARSLPGKAAGMSASAVAETVSFLNRVQPQPALDFSRTLMLGAQMHVADQGRRGSVGHAGSDRSRPWDRMERAGGWSGRAGENISYGHSDAGKIVAQLIVDQNVPGKGHRKNIFSPGFAVAGVACGPHARYGAMCVIDFAGGGARSSESKIAAANSVYAGGNWAAFDSMRVR